MSPNVLKRPRAEQDLLDHFVYLGQRNPAAAERFLDAVEQAVERLAQKPGMGRLWSSDSPRLEGVRSWAVPKFKNYRIFYRSLPDGIELLRVLHARRDLQALLDADEP